MIIKIQDRDGGITERFEVKKEFADLILKMCRNYEFTPDEE